MTTPNESQSTRTDGIAKQKPVAPTPFHESMALLNTRVDWIPTGWQALYAEMRLRLYAVFCEGREPIFFLGGYEEDGHLLVETHAPDFVVQGILRKARAKAACTCMECGQPGKRRELEDWREMVLCGTCAAPRLLHLQIQRLLALDRCGTLDDARDPLMHPDARLLREAAEACGHVREEDRLVLAGKVSNELREWVKRLLEHVQFRIVTGH